MSKNGKNGHKRNGHKRQRISREATVKARQKVYDKALKVGYVTNTQAKRIGGWSQSWYHLNKLAEAGYLKREEYDCWVPIRRRGRLKQLAV